METKNKKSDPCKSAVIVVHQDNLKILKEKGEKFSASLPGQVLKKDDRISFNGILMIVTDLKPSPSAKIHTDTTVTIKSTKEAIILRCIQCGSVSKKTMKFCNQCGNSLPVVILDSSHAGDSYPQQKKSRSAENTMDPMVPVPQKYKKNLNVEFKKLKVWVPVFVMIALALLIVWKVWWTNGHSSGQIEDPVKKSDSIPVIKDMKTKENRDMIFRVVRVSYDDVLNVREYPDPKSRIIAKIPPDYREVKWLGDKVSVKGRKQYFDWYKINYKGHIGWVNSYFLEKK